MEYFEEFGLDYDALIESIRRKYGLCIHIMNRRKVPMGGFLCFGRKEGWCVTGYVSDSPFQPKERSSGGNLKRLEELLEKNDFSAKYIGFVVAEIERNSHEESLKSWGYVLKRARDLIESSIDIYRSRSVSPPAVTALIGPTGVGKTTTVAKLAAMYKKRGVRVGIISTDRYKVGADKQIETLASVIGIPFSNVRGMDALCRQMRGWALDADRILIDTPGRNPRESESIMTLESLLTLPDVRIEKLLCVSATTKMSDLTEILGQFGTFGYDAVVCTKMDETSRAGNLISALHQAGKSFAYITSGQKISAGVEVPGVETLFEFLEGFDVV